MLKKVWMFGMIGLLVGYPALVLEAKDELGEKLIEQVMAQDLEGVKTLVEKGADVNYQNESSQATALMMAANYEMFDIAEFLLEEGADVNRRDANGMTALMAAAGRSQEMVELLLEHGADITITPTKGAGAFTNCIVAVMTERVPLSLAERLLEEGANVDEPRPSGRSQGYTPLMIVARNGDVKLAEFLVEHGADVNAKAEDGTTALSLAKKKEQEDIVKYLVKMGAK